MKEVVILLCLISTSAFATEIQGEIDSKEWTGVKAFAADFQPGIMSIYFTADKNATCRDYQVSWALSEDPRVALIFVPTDASSMQICKTHELKNCFTLTMARHDLKNNVTYNYPAQSGQLQLSSLPNSVRGKFEGASNLDVGNRLAGEFEAEYCP
jgi:hypothetical protein